MRDSSSRKVTTRVRRQPSSTPQCHRTAWANAFASASTGRLLMSYRSSSEDLPSRTTSETARPIDRSPRHASNPGRLGGASSWKYVRRPVQRPLVPLQRQHVAPLRDRDCPGDLLLAAHRDHRPGDVHQLRQRGDRRDLFGLRVAGGQPQRRPVLAGPGAHRLERPQAVLAFVAASRRLAVDGQRPPLDAGLGRGLGAQRPHSGGEAGPERLGPRGHRHATEHVLAGDPVRPCQDRLEELLLEGRPSRDRRRPGGPRQHRDQRDDRRRGQGLLAVDRGCGSSNSWRYASTSSRPDRRESAIDPPRLRPMTPQGGWSNRTRALRVRQNYQKYTLVLGEREGVRHPRHVAGMPSSTTRRAEPVNGR